jgi:hypothetical protein
MLIKVQLMKNPALHELLRRSCNTDSANGSSYITSERAEERSPEQRGEIHLACEEQGSAKLRIVATA